MSNNQARWELLLSEYAKNPRLPDWQSPSLPVPFEDVDSAFNRYGIQLGLQDTEVFEIRDSKLNEYQKKYTVYQPFQASEVPGRYVDADEILGTITISKVSKNQTELAINATGYQNNYFERVISTFLSNWMAEREIDNSAAWLGEDGDVGETAVFEESSKSPLTEKIVICKKGDRNQLGELFKTYFSDKEPVNGFYLRPKYGGPIKQVKDFSRYRYQGHVLSLVGWNISHMEVKEPVGLVDTYPFPIGMRVRFKVFANKDWLSVQPLIDSAVQRMNEWGFDCDTNKPLSEGETAVYPTLPGLINPALLNAQDVALNTTGHTVRGEVLNQSDAELFERSERLARIEERQNPYHSASDHFENEDEIVGETAVYPQITITNNEDGTFKAESRQYKSFRVEVLPENFKTWCNAYFLSIGQDRIYPSLDNTIGELRELGQKSYAYAFMGCLVQFVIRVEEPEKLLITPMSINYVVDEKSRGENLSVAESHIVDLVAAAKKRFSSLYQRETAVSSRLNSLTDYAAPNFAPPQESELARGAIDPSSVTYYGIEDEIKGTANTTLYRQGKLNPGYEHTLDDMVIAGLSRSKDKKEVTAVSRQDDSIQPKEAPEIQERRQKVKELYLAGKLKIWQISRSLNTSESTINRDLKALEELGEIKRKRR